MVQPAESLGSEPSVEAIDQWMRSWSSYKGSAKLVMKRKVVGKSYKRRDLVAYEFLLGSRGEPFEYEHIPTFLFMSLVHGNEPMGLLSLLHTVEHLLTSAVSNTAVRLVFFPVVNVDAYLANLRLGQGCRRTNLHVSSFCKLPSWGPDPAICSPERLSEFPVPVPGVDLNRNYPSGYDWGPNDWNPRPACRNNFGGEAPFSEPETRAVRNLVFGYYKAESGESSLVAFMSFHTRAQGNRPALLIHPYASHRPLSDMPIERSRRYRSWSRTISEATMNANNESIYGGIGTALEAIKYAAAGTTIDWLETQHRCISFVVEVSPPCLGRWCSDISTQDIEAGIRVHAKAAKQLVELVLSNNITSTRPLPLPLGQSSFDGLGRHGLTALVWFSLVCFFTLYWRRKRVTSHFKDAN